MIQILMGPRQCGKSTLFSWLLPKAAQEVTFDDLQLRQLANRDPALFLDQFDSPLLLDEVQYVPNLFPELKKRVDLEKKQALFSGDKKNQGMFYLTGSHQVLMDKNIKESLAGRASYFYLNTLTVHEILNAHPKMRIQEILFKGGWPELYLNNAPSVINYLNDYIRSYVEKDLVLETGIKRFSEFHTVLGLLGARTGQLTDYAGLAKDSGVSAVTIKSWIGFLERADLVFSLKPYFSNLNKRLIKTPKFYFLDTGLAARLQGWTDIIPLFNSPQIGFLFETLVLGEIVKFIRNYGKDWQLFFLRTKEGEEIDFLIKIGQVIYPFEAKLAIQGVSEPTPYPTVLKKDFPSASPLVIVTFGGKQLTLSKDCLVVPIANLHDYLQSLCRV
jgi:predicted AAA+ superfamily ATPase